MDIDNNSQKNTIVEPENKNAPKKRLAFLIAVFEFLKVAALALIIVVPVRYFLFQPFIVQGESMAPNFASGDYLIVDEISYSFSTPQRGDVMVFKYPKDTSLDYIKRVIGVPGDKIIYKNKRLSVNGKDLSYQSLPDYLDEEHLVYSKQFSENLGGVEHRIANVEAAPAFVSNPDDFPQRELCNYNAEGFACTVPPGHYFMMGDNRDNSMDSRYWGFVPEQNIVGKAFVVWMNLSNFPNNLRRIGSF